MLKINDLKPGDIISVNDDGVVREGTVVKVSHEEHQALVNNGIQEFWYSLDDMKSIPLDDNQLTRLGFTREEQNGGVKYKKDSFRSVTPKNGDFSSLEMWWREDRRHFNFPIGVHEAPEPPFIHDKSAAGKALSPAFQAVFRVHWAL